MNQSRHFPSDISKSDSSVSTKSQGMTESMSWIAPVTRPFPFIVEIIVCSARNLYSLPNLFSTYHPFAVVYLTHPGENSRLGATKVDNKNNRCPFWDETFSSPITSTAIEHGQICIHIWNYNGDHYIGCASIELKEIVDEVGLGEWAHRCLKPESLSSFYTSKGKVQVKIKLRKFSNDHPDPDPAHAPSSNLLQINSEFTLLEIEEATKRFDSSLMIGRGGYGSVYRGFLRNTQVAIKVLNSRSSQGPSEFQQEVNVLSRMRHPNLVILIGACTEACSLIYEYLPNGSLGDRLDCKGDTTPLPWQTRVSIAIEVCSALIFLHSNKPHSIIHGDIKPSNILLDANLVSKLGDFGLCHLASKNNDDTSTPFCITDPKGTFGYIDPEFLATGKLTTKSDVYSFGVVLLVLLTGKTACGLLIEVQNALEKGKFTTMLDKTAGDWPVSLTKQVARLALSCCERKGRNRPNLNSEVWALLEQLKSSCGNSSPLCLASEEYHDALSYFYQESNNLIE